MPFKEPNICPRCGKRGFRTGRMVGATYYPKYSSLICEEVKEKRKELAIDRDNKDLKEWLKHFGSRVKGHRYWGTNRSSFADKIGRHDFKDQGYYRVTAKRKYYYYYFGHYDLEKYQQQMVDYRDGRRKSRPNGRSWCKEPARASHGPLKRVPTVRRDNYGLI